MLIFIYIIIPSFTFTNDKVIFPQRMINKYVTRTTHIVQGDLREEGVMF